MTLDTTFAAAIAIIVAALGGGGIGGWLMLGHAKRKALAETGLVDAETARTNAETAQVNTQVADARRESEVQILRSIASDLKDQIDHYRELLTATEQRYNQLLAAGAVTSKELASARRALAKQRRTIDQLQRRIEQLEATLTSNGIEIPPAH